MSVPLQVAGKPVVIRTFPPAAPPLGKCWTALLSPSRCTRCPAWGGAGMLVVRGEDVRFLGGARGPRRPTYRVLVVPKIELAVLTLLGRGCHRDQTRGGRGRVRGSLETPRRRIWRREGQRPALMRRKGASTGGQGQSLTQRRSIHGRHVTQCQVWRRVLFEV